MPYKSSYSFQNCCWYFGDSDANGNVDASVTILLCLHHAPKIEWNVVLFFYLFHIFISHTIKTFNSLSLTNILSISNWNLVYTCTVFTNPLAHTPSTAPNSLTFHLFHENIFEICYFIITSRFNCVIHWIRASFSFSQSN